jgi:UPF0755 protein
LAALGLVGLLICGITVFAISGGRIGDFVQTQLALFRLNARQTDLSRALGTDNTPLRFTINPGETPRIIAQNLIAAGLIDDPDLFLDFVRAYGIDVQLEAGIFFLYRTQTIPQIANALTDSASSQFAFRILEGQRLEEVAFQLIDGNRFFGFTGADFMAVAGPGTLQDAAFAQFVGLPGGASLEGFLFPNTYQLPAAVTPTLLRDTLLDQFVVRVGTDMPSQAAEQGLTLYQLVTLASIVQREAVRVDEMPLIAGVYRNRLRIGMKLDADPTVQYGIGFRGGSWWPQITIDDYSTALSPYNTYLNNGLPPGPIASPGIAAINAALTPQPSEFFYFRARCDGSGYHTFAATFQEHLANACP